MPLEGSEGRTASDAVRKSHQQTRKGSGQKIIGVNSRDSRAALFFLLSVSSA